MTVWALTRRVLPFRDAVGAVVPKVVAYQVQQRDHLVHVALSPDRVGHAVVTHQRKGFIPSPQLVGKRDGPKVFFAAGVEVGILCETLAPDGILFILENELRLGGVVRRFRGKLFKLQLELLAVLRVGPGEGVFIREVQGGHRAPIGVVEGKYKLAVLDPPGGREVVRFVGIDYQEEPGVPGRSDEAHLRFILGIFAGRGAGMETSLPYAAEMGEHLLLRIFQEALLLFCGLLALL